MSVIKVLREDRVVEISAVGAQGPPGASTFIGLDDTPGAYTTPGFLVGINPGADGLVFIDPAAFGGGSTTFVGLVDTPGSITALAFPRGNSAGDALEFEEVHYRTGTAAETLSALRVVRETASGVELALASSFEELRAALGITIGAAASGNPVTYKVSGELSDGSWSWTPEATLFVADDGTISETPGTHLRPVGIAVDATTISINFGTPIRR